MASRLLKQDEIAELRKVYGNSLDTSVIYISDIMESQGYAITLTGKDIKITGKWIYQICWNSTVFRNGAKTAAEKYNSGSRERSRLAGTARHTSDILYGKVGFFPSL